MTDAISYEQFDAAVAAQILRVILKVRDDRAAVGSPTGWIYAFYNELRLLEVRVTNIYGGHDVAALSSRDIEAAELWAKSLASSIRGHK